MANEQNEQAQNPQEEQLEAHDQQTQAESSSGHLETDSEDLKAQITKLEESLKLEKARAANAIYESEKVKERLEREAETAKKFALEKFAKNLLETVDNLERALQATGEEQTPLSEGVELTLKGLLTTLEKAGVVVVDTANGFNADLHQAVGIDPNAKSGEIGTVLQKAIPYPVDCYDLQWSW